jgi:hypothetical protein
VMIPLSDRVPGRASEPSWTRIDDGGGYENFLGWRLGSLGFSWGCEYIGGRARSVGARGAHTMGQHGQGGPRHQVWPPRCPTLSPLRTPWTCQKNRNFSFFHPIPRIFPSVKIWNRKIAENRNWHYDILLIG